MLSTAILDVAIGLIFTFLAVSLAAGAVVEALASFFKLRSTTLKAGVMQLLNDPGFDQLAADLYAHALVNPRGPGTKPQPAASGAPAAPASGHGAMRAKVQWHLAAAAEILPAYIDPKQFSGALIDILSLAPSGGVALTVQELLAKVDDCVPKDANPQINQLLHGIIVRAGGNLAKVQTDLAAWFDNAMDRVGGVYKRTTQVVAFAAALGISILFNADAFQVTQRVWAQPVLVADLKVGATAQSADDAKWQLLQSLPVGWAQPPTAPRDWIFAAIGWLFTAIASLFGAPFWFDTLQRIIRIKGSGPSPAEKADNTGAAA